MAVQRARSSKRACEASYIETQQMQEALKIQINKTAGTIAKMHDPIGVSSMKKLVEPSDTKCAVLGRKRVWRSQKMSMIQLCIWLTSIVPAYTHQQMRRHALEDFHGA